MAARVVTDLCKALGNNKATVVVEADGLEEVMSAAVRNMAIAHASAMGVARPGIQSATGTWPVDRNGSDDPGDVAKAGKDRRYRAEYPIQGGL